MWDYTTADTFADTTADTFSDTTADTFSDTFSDTFAEDGTGVENGTCVDGRATPGSE